MAAPTVNEPSERSVMIYPEGRKLDRPDATVGMPKSALSEIQLGTTTFTGDRTTVDDLIGVLVRFNPLFGIVTR